MHFVGLRIIFTLMPLLEGGPSVCPTGRVLWLICLVLIVIYNAGYV
jgi:hypothetical protein